MDNLTTFYSSEGILLGSLVIVSSLALVVYLKVNAMKKTAETAPFPGIPMAPGGHWLLGHLPAMMGDDGFAGIKRINQDFCDPKTGMSCHWMANEPSFSVLWGSDAKAVLASGSAKPSYSYVDRHLGEFLGKRSILVLQGKEWKHQRMAIHKSFTHAAMQASQPKINQVGATLARSLLGAIEDSITKDLTRPVLPLMKMATLDVFGSAVLGVDFESSKNLQLHQVAQSFTFLEEEFQRRVSLPFNIAANAYWMPTKANQEHTHHQNYIRDFTKTQIEVAQHRLKNGKSSKTDVLSNLVATTANTNSDDQDILDQICDISLTLLFAGYDTTSIALSYTLYLLAKNPAVQAECLKEIKAFFGTAGNDGSYQLGGPDDLPYTKAVIQEAMRLYSPAVFTMRILEKEMTLHGKTFPKGTRVMIPIWIIHRHEHNFPSPMEMRPDRWVRRSTQEMPEGSSSWEERPSDDFESSDIAPGNKDAFTVFSAGARNCVGKNLAYRQAVTILAYTVHKVKFELVDESYEVTPEMKMLQGPSDGLPMRISRRSDM